MRLTSFRIKNFKGIVDLTLDLDDDPASPIHVLVGLNESGKTTILEALSFFSQNLELKENLSLSKGVVDDVHSLIPKARKDNFSNSVVLDASLSVAREDADILKKELRSDILLTGFPTHIQITQYYDFVNSTFKGKRTTWNSGLKGKKQGQRRSTKLDTSDLAKAWSAVRKLLPHFVFYPNFLFTFPDRIYLEASPTESREQTFYRRVIQDVLDAIENDLTIETHIVKRARSGALADLDALESVLNKASAQITRAIFSSELSVFKQRSLPRSIILSTPKVDQAHNLLYLEVKLKEGDDSFYIRERSLGFQWFFTFLLFTKFRTHRNDRDREIVFLLDEPASNLHQTAQERLVRALHQLTNQDGITVIYSTHSHHLLDPNWLPATFVVRNKALDYESDDTFSAKQTDIVADRYRVFVASYPALRTYFQPILDLLEYRPSNLEAAVDVVMVEGKGDYSVLRYFVEVISNSSPRLNLLPGSGAGTLDCAIQLYVGWGRSFVVLLDGDAEGVKQAERLRGKFGVSVRQRVFTLADVDARWKGLALEQVIPEPDRICVQQSVFPGSTKFDKKQFRLAVEENLLKCAVVPFSEEGLRRLSEICRFLAERL